MPRVHSSQPVTVEQAQLINPGDFRFDTSIAKSITGIGNVLQELGERKKQMQDKLAVSDVNAAMEQAELDYQMDIAGRPVDEHAGILLKHKNRAKQIAARTKASGEVRSLIDNKLSIWDQSVTTQAELATIKAIEKDTTIRVTADYEKALTEGTVDDIDEAEVALDEHFDGTFEPAEAEQLKLAAMERAEEQIKKDAVKVQTDLSAINPTGRMGAIQAELQSRKDGNEPSLGWANIDDTTLRQIESYTKTLVGKQKTQSEINMQESLNNSYTAIREGDNDIGSMIALNNADPTQTTEEKIEFAEKLPTYFTKINSTKIPEQTDEIAYDLLTKGTESVERGAMSPTEFEELFADNADKLTTQDRRSIRSGDIVATKTMQNRTFLDATNLSRTVLVQATQDQITAMDTARKAAELDGDIKAVKMFSAALTLHSAQVWSQSLLRKELRSMMNQNPEWSAEDIFVAGDVLTNQFDIPDAELINSYDKARPELDILGRSPIPELDNVWKDISEEDRSIILNLKLQGVADSDIIQELESEQP